MTLMSTTDTSTILLLIHIPSSTFILICCRLLLHISYQKATKKLRFLPHLHPIINSITPPLRQLLFSNDQEGDPLSRNTPTCKKNQRRLIIKGRKIWKYWLDITRMSRETHKENIRSTRLQSRKSASSRNQLAARAPKKATYRGLKGRRGDLCMVGTDIKFYYKTF